MGTCNRIYLSSSNLSVSGIALDTRNLEPITRITRASTSSVTDLYNFVHGCIIGELGNQLLQPSLGAVLCRLARSDLQTRSRFESVGLS